ncbi:MAG: DNA topoisomerase III [Mycoplasmatales bacterium]
MSKIVVLAEKPSVGKDIARVLGCKQVKNGSIEGNKYIVTWALGHLVSLADPENYSKQYANWNLEQLPILFDRPKFTVLKQTAKQYSNVKKILERKDIESLVIATDAGREGELVARLIILKTGFKKPIKRLWISSVTDKAIKEGFAKLSDGKKYQNLYMSALARAESDWLVGINATRALTTKYNTQLSCGRVQTPTLQMIMEQDDKIKNFKPQMYYNIRAFAKGVQFTYLDSKKQSRIFQAENSQKIVESIDKQMLEVVEITRKEKRTNPRQLYDLTTLQREANQQYGYSAKYTLDIMQSLYEYHKIVTYPRTDSNYLTTDMVSTLKERITASKVFAFGHVIDKLDLAKVNKNTFVNNAKVSDHHAIIPTEVKANLSRLSVEEERIYKMIVQRFYAVLLPATVYEDQQIIAKINNHTFIAKGQKVKSAGWKAVYERVLDLTDDFEQEDDIQMQELADFSEKTKYVVEKVSTTENYTKPPKHFTEGSLLSAMENPTRFVESEKAKQTLRTTGGIGTVATRADIIEKLQNSFLIAKQNQSIVITSKGRQLLQVAPTDLKSPLLTASWEDKLKQIEQGKLKKEKFIMEIKDYTEEVIHTIKHDTFEFTHDNLTKQSCEKCGKPMMFVEGKKGKMLVCSSVECKHRVNINLNPRMQCPNCRKKLKILGDSFEKQAIYCEGCGYRETLVSIMNKSSSKNSASKSDVKKMAKSEKSQKTATYNPFANLLDKLDE